MRSKNRNNFSPFSLSTKDHEQLLKASQIKSSCSGGRFLAEFEGEIQLVETPLPFSFNIENSLMMLAAMNLVYGGLSIATKLLKKVTPPPGRCEVTALSNGATAIVDYAHNCNSLDNLLNNAREHSAGNIITVSVKFRRCTVDLWQRS